MRLILVGYAVKGSRTRQRIRALEEMDHDLTVIDTAPHGRTYEDRPSAIARIRHRLRLPADETDANRALVAAATGTELIWIENASMIRPGTLSAIRSMAIPPRIVWYSEDDMMRPRNGSLWIDRSWTLFDLCVTTKSFNAAPAELPARGARRVLFVNNSFDPDIHRKVSPDPGTLSRLGADVTFVGTFEEPRAKSLLHLAQSGIGVRVWGNGWARMSNVHRLLRIEGRPVYDDEYAQVVAASRINLAFLRQANRDLQTTRSIELPACGGFMLHQYSDEMAALLAPDRESGYFSSDDELIAACRRWLSTDDDRRRVADAGHRRIAGGGFRHCDMLTRAISAAMTKDTRCIGA